MILSFRHKGLRRFFEGGDRRGIDAGQSGKISLILLALHSADEIAAVDLPSFRLHPLTGKMKGLWSVTVRANWRITFRFEGGNAYDVDLVDYH